MIVDIHSIILREMNKDQSPESSHPDILLPTKPSKHFLIRVIASADCHRVINVHTFYSDLRRKAVNEDDTKGNVANVSVLHEQR